MNNAPPRALTIVDNVSLGVLWPLRFIRSEQSDEKPLALTSVYIAGSQALGRWEWAFQKMRRSRMCELLPSSLLLF
jgi:hypothetical protein